MKKYTNFEYETGPSRAFTRKDETQLFTILALVIIVAVFVVAFEYSGMADAFVQYASNIVLWLRSS